MKITVQDYRRTQTKHRKAKKGHGWTKLERIEMDCIWVNLKNDGSLFFKFMSVNIKISFTPRENHSQLLCRRLWPTQSAGKSVQASNDWLLLLLG